MIPLLLRLAFLAVGVGCLLGAWGAARRYRRRPRIIGPACAVVWCSIAAVGAGLLVAGVIG